MDYYDIIRSIRNIERNIKLDEKIEIEELSNILNNHGCYYLSNKIFDNSSKISENKKYMYKYYEMCKEFFIILEEESIDYAVLKGVPLAIGAYKNIGNRMSRDIDILIDRSNIQKVKKILLNLGYKQGNIVDKVFVPIDRKKEVFYITKSHQIAPFVLETGIKEMPYIEIDINKELMWGESEFKLDIKEILKSRVEFRLSTNIEFKTLNPTHFFIALCLHHYKDMNSHYILYRKNGISLRRICDLYYYLKNNKEVCTPLKIAHYCEKYKIKEFIYFCIYYCKEIFEDEFLDSYMKHLESEEGIKGIDSFGLNSDEKEKWKINFIERIFSENLREYLRENLSEKNIDKINYNIENLH